MRKIGITTTVPIEAVYAGKCLPIDINNLFISDKTPVKYINDAELDAFPRNICAWIKGIYAASKKYKLKEIIAVHQGDCSNTLAMTERMELDKIKIIPFGYPFDRDENILKYRIENLLKYFGTDWNKANQVKKELDEIRKYAHEIDYLSWHDKKITGFESHLWQVSTSDFNQNPEKYKAEAKEFITKAKKRKSKTDKINLGYIGVPPIVPKIYPFIEKHGGNIIFNEVQRQFTMPQKSNDLIEQYLKYNYPYDVFTKIEDIKKEIKKRSLKGIIHYVQSFCFRKIEDEIYRRSIDIPILTLECDLPGEISARDKTRLEVFMEMLKQ